MSGENKNEEKEKTIGVSPRLPESIVKRLDRFGNRSKGINKIVRQFITVSELISSSTNAPITTKDGSVIYGTSIFPNELYHFTTKKGDEIVTHELDRAAVAQLVSNLVDLLNTDYKKLTEV